MNVFNWGLKSDYLAGILAPVFVYLLSDFEHATEPI